jgi:hypothetical protein
MQKQQHHCEDVAHWFNKQRAKGKVPSLAALVQALVVGIPRKRRESRSR